MSWAESGERNGADDSDRGIPNHIVGSGRDNKKWDEDDTGTGKDKATNDRVECAAGHGANEAPIV